MNKTLAIRDYFVSELELLGYKVIEVTPNTIKFLFGDWWVAGFCFDKFSQQWHTTTPAFRLFLNARIKRFNENLIKTS